MKSYSFENYFAEQIQSGIKITNRQLELIGSKAIAGFPELLEVDSVIFSFPELTKTISIKMYEWN